MWPPRGGRGRRLLLLWTLAAFAGCDGGSTSDPTHTLESLVPRTRTAHFEVHADRASNETVAEIAAGLEARYGRDGSSVLRLLSVPEVVRNATHEMAHAISLRANPTFANRPRWLWESVALFENDELVDPRSIPYLVQGRFPTLTELDADPNASRQVYEVGYLIGEFVVARAGRAGLLRLVRANGDVTSVGFSSPAAFESEWATFVRARYFGAGLTLAEPVP